MSVLDQIRKLDEQRAKLLDDAKKEALAAAQNAVSQLNELGFNYRLVEGTTSTGGTGKRRTGIRSEVLGAVKGFPKGATRAQVLAAMNADDKSSQQSISNALSALKKAGTVTLADGVYKAV